MKMLSVNLQQSNDLGSDVTILQVVISKTQWEYLSEAKNHFYCPFLSLKRKKREKNQVKMYDF